MKIGQIQEAMALRVKYRKGKPDTYKVNQLGVHMMNRGGHGIYPNGSDVVHLGKKIIQGGIDMFCKMGELSAQPLAPGAAPPGLPPRGGRLRRKRFHFTKHPVL